MSCKSLLNIHQLELNLSIERRFAVENSVILNLKYIIQTIKRQQPHLSNNNLSVLDIGQGQCIAAFIVAVYFFIITNNPTNMIVLNGPACGVIVFNVNEGYCFLRLHWSNIRVRMPIRRYNQEYSPTHGDVTWLCMLFLKFYQRPSAFHFVGSEEKLFVQRETRLFRSWNTLPCAQNFKPKFEFKTSLALNSPVGT